MECAPTTYSKPDWSTLRSVTIAMLGTSLRVSRIFNPCCRRRLELRADAAPAALRGNSAGRHPGGPRDLAAWLAAPALLGHLQRLLRRQADAAAHRSPPPSLRLHRVGARPGDGPFTALGQRRPGLVQPQGRVLAAGPVQRQRRELPGRRAQPDGRSEALPEQRNVERLLQRAVPGAAGRRRVLVLQPEQARQGRGRLRTHGQQRRRRQLPAAEGLLRAVRVRRVQEERALPVGRVVRRGVRADAGGARAG